MSWDRIERQEAILLEKIAVLIQRLNDPRVGFVTITGTKLSRDKRYCNVSFSVFGTDSEIRKTTRALAAAAPRVREMLAPSLDSRVLPELRFIFDAEVVKESNLRILIEEVTAEREEREGPDGDLSELLRKDEEEGDDADPFEDGTAFVEDSDAADEAPEDAEPRPDGSS
ncbi:MAG: ribosome-binding factor A [Pseudohongiellaceae bacterium]|jgi:ribosome-binding factor A